MATEVKGGAMVTRRAGARVTIAHRRSCRIRPIGDNLYLEGRGAVMYRQGDILTSKDSEVEISAGTEWADPIQALRDRVEGDPIARGVSQDATRRRSMLAAMQMLRTTKKLSQRTVASAMGTTQSAISDIESGRVEPQLQTLQRYARALGGSRLDVAIVDDDLPVYEEGMANGLWQLVEKHALSPLLTALVTQPDEERRTLDQLASFAQLPAPIVAPILASLEQRDWVVGRKPGDADELVYSLSESAAYVIGVSLHRHRVVGVLTDLQANTVHTTIRPLKNTIRATVLHAAREVIEELYGVPRDREILGIGVSVAGVVRTDETHKQTGKVRYAPDLDSPEDRWRDMPLESELEDDVKKTLDQDLLVVVENDANALAMREYLRVGDNSVIVVLMSGSGIGAGYAQDGEVSFGANFAGGELGHTNVSSTGRKCRAGFDHNGCLETVASAEGILHSLKIPANTPLEIEEGLAAANDRAEKGNTEAVEAFTKAGEVLGRTLAPTVALLDPARVVFYGHRQLVNTHPSGVSSVSDHRPYLSADLFQKGVVAGLGVAAVGMKGKFADPLLEWNEVEETTNAVAAGTAAMRHFLLDPAHWRPSVLASRTLASADGAWS